MLSLPWRGEDRDGLALAVREAGPRDATRYLDHIRELVRETRWMLQSPLDALPSAPEQRLLIEHLRRLDGCLALLATRPGWTRGGDRIVGALTLLSGTTARTRHAAQLSMGVRRAHWGVGVGSALLDVALTWARRHPIVRRVSLQVYEDNVGARALYRSRGFLSEGVLDADARHPQTGALETLVGMGIDVSQ